ncbi:hypothetical protein DIURU_002888 [Diutina rugosa]|uniref:Uncharacterized protein n=1 Tax=Diutina rugosa TaxID=5481 RepID=A0A642UNH0_DIURU|nr:uncharacterized protein DIURU_002888 [Diutina rugosa]KAA8902434.1 hypothetical protein DIURU_002888 [Diutina rugosa]
MTSASRQYVYNPKPSYHTGPVKATPARRASSLTAQSAKPPPRRRLSIDHALSSTQQVEEEDEDEDCLVTTKTTKVLDQYGRTQSITTKTIRTLADGSRTIETTTRNISRSGSRSNSLRTGSLLSNQVQPQPLNLDKIDEDLQDFDYNYLDENQPLQLNQHHPTKREQQQQPYVSPPLKPVDVRTNSLSSSSSQPKLRSILKNTQRPPLADEATRIEVINDADIELEPHPYQNLKQTPKSPPLSPPQVQQSEFVTMERLSSPGGSIKFNNMVETHHYYDASKKSRTSPQQPQPGKRGTNKEALGASSTAPPSADFYAAALEAAHRKVYGDRDPNQVAAAGAAGGAAGGAAVASPPIPQDIQVKPLVVQDDGVQANYNYENHHKSFVGTSLRDGVPASKRDRERELERERKRQAKEAKAQAKEAKAQAKDAEGKKGVLGGLFKRRRASEEEELEVASPEAAQAQFTPPQSPGFIETHQDVQKSNSFKDKLKHGGQRIFEKFEAPVQGKPEDYAKDTVAVGAVGATAAGANGVGGVANANANVNSPPAQGFAINSRDGRSSFERRSSAERFGPSSGPVSLPQQQQQQQQVRAQPAQVSAVAVQDTVVSAGGVTQATRTVVEERSPAVQQAVHQAASRPVESMPIIGTPTAPKLTKDEGLITDERQKALGPAFQGKNQQQPATTTGAVVANPDEYQHGVQDGFRRGEQLNEQDYERGLNAGYQQGEVRNEQDYERGLNAGYVAGEARNEKDYQRGVHDAQREAELRQRELELRQREAEQARLEQARKAEQAREAQQQAEYQRGLQSEHLNEQDYQRGLAAGFEQGEAQNEAEYDRGLAAGIQAGEAQSEADYQRGIVEGQAAGQAQLDADYQRGLAAGREAGKAQAEADYERGLQAGREAGAAQLEQERQREIEAEQQRQREIEAEQQRQREIEAEQERQRELEAEQERQRELEAQRAKEQALQRERQREQEQIAWAQAEQARQADYQRGLNDGLQTGENENEQDYERGLEAGYEQGEVLNDADHQRGLNAGFKQGEVKNEQDYDRGLAAGFHQGEVQNDRDFDRGLNAGYQQGEAQIKQSQASYEEEYRQGYKAGYKRGLELLDEEKAKAAPAVATANSTLPTTSTTAPTVVPTTGIVGKSTTATTATPVTPSKPQQPVVVQRTVVAAAAERPESGELGVIDSYAVTSDEAASPDAERTPLQRNKSSSSYKRISKLGAFFSRNKSKDKVKDKEAEAAATKQRKGSSDSSATAPNFSATAPNAIGTVFAGGATSAKSANVPQVARTTKQDPVENTAFASLPRSSSTNVRNAATTGTAANTSNFDNLETVEVGELDGESDEEWGTPPPELKEPVDFPIAAASTNKEKSKAQSEALITEPQHAYSQHARQPEPLLTDRQAEPLITDRNVGETYPEPSYSVSEPLRDEDELNEAYDDAFDRTSDTSNYSAGDNREHGLPVESVQRSAGVNPATDSIPVVVPLDSSKAAHVQDLPVVNPTGVSAPTQRTVEPLNDDVDPSSYAHTKIAVPTLEDVGTPGFDSAEAIDTGSSYFAESIRKPNTDGYNTHSDSTYDYSNLPDSRYASKADMPAPNIMSDVPEDVESPQHSPRVPKDLASAAAAAAPAAAVRDVNVREGNTPIYANATKQSSKTATAANTTTSPKVTPSSPKATYVGSGSTQHQFTTPHHVSHKQHAGPTISAQAKAASPEPQNMTRGVEAAFARGSHALNHQPQQQPQAYQTTYQTTTHQRTRSGGGFAPPKTSQNRASHAAKKSTTSSFYDVDNIVSDTEDRDSLLGRQAAAKTRYSGELDREVLIQQEARATHVVTNATPVASPSSSARLQQERTPIVTDLVEPKRKSLDPKRADATAAIGTTGAAATAASPRTPQLQQGAGFGTSPSTQQSPQGLPYGQHTPREAPHLGGAPQKPSASVNTTPKSLVGASAHTTPASPQVINAGGFGYLADTEPRPKFSNNSEHSTSTHSEQPTNSTALTNPNEFIQEETYMTEETEVIPQAQAATGVAPASPSAVANETTVSDVTIDDGPKKKKRGGKFKSKIMKYFVNPQVA